MVAKGVKITPTGYEYPIDYTGPHLPEPSALPADDADALAVVAYGGYDDSAAAAGAPGDAGHGYAFALPMMGAEGMDPTFVQYMQAFAGIGDGSGGGVVFSDSAAPSAAKRARTDE